MVETTDALRKWVLALLALGSAGTLVELILMGHYEDAWQYVPLFGIGLAGAVISWHLALPSLASLRAFQIVMALFVVFGVLGVWLHFEGAASFQREIDPSIDGWTLLTKTLKSKAPPVLAPGLLSQLGLLGFAYSFRHPVLFRGGGDDRRIQKVK